MRLAGATFEKLQAQTDGKLEQREQAVKALVEPIGKSLEGVRSKIDELEKSRAEAYGSLTAQVRSMIVTQDQLRLEAGNLVKALRAPQTRGRWGEIQLKRVVEMAGMLDYCDFEQQVSVSADDGRLRRDVPAWRVVLQRRAGAAAGLIEDGVKQGVIVATPTTLIALLRAVSYGWRQETIAENAQAIATLGRDLYERVGKLAEHFGKLGKNLGTAVNTYNDAVGTLESRVLPQARRFKELGAGNGDIAVLEGLQQATRQLQAPELTAAEQKLLPSD